MARLRYNNALGTLGASLTSSGTTITFASAPLFATLGANDYVPLVLDPSASSAPNASFEIVHLTAYTSGATTGTIVRGQEGTTGMAHANGATWMCAPTVSDAGRTGSFAKIIDIMADFGATFDGVTDDTTAWQNCISSLTSQRGAGSGQTVILVPPWGTSIVTSTILFDQVWGLTITSLGIGSNNQNSTAPNGPIIQYQGTSGSLFDFQSCHSILIRGIAFRYKNASYYGPGTDLLAFDHLAASGSQADCSYCYIEACTFMGLDGHANCFVRFNQSIDFGISECVFFPHVSYPLFDIVLGNNNPTPRTGQGNQYCNVWKIDKCSMNSPILGTVLIASTDCENGEISNNTFEECPGLRYADNPSGLSVIALGSGGGSPGFNGSTQYWKVSCLNTNAVMLQGYSAGTFFGGNSGGETPMSSEVSASPVTGGSAQLTMNVPLGASQINVYRASTPGGETISPALVGSISLVCDHEQTWAEQVSYVATEVVFDPATAINYVATTAQTLNFNITATTTNGSTAVTGMSGSVPPVGAVCAVGTQLGVPGTATLTITGASTGTLSAAAGVGAGTGTLSIQGFPPAANSAAGLYWSTTISFVDTGTALQAGSGSTGTNSTGYGGGICTNRQSQSFLWLYILRNGFEDATGRQTPWIHGLNAQNNEISTIGDNLFGPNTGMSGNVTNNIVPIILIDGTWKIEGNEFNQMGISGHAAGNVLSLDTNHWATSSASGAAPWFTNPWNPNGTVNVTSQIGELGRGVGDSFQSGATQFNAVTAAQGFTVNTNFSFFNNPNRWLGAPASAAPTSTSMVSLQGDWAGPDQNGQDWVCITGGSPGVWVPKGSIRKRNAQSGTSYTFALTDVGLAVAMTNSSASTITIPPNSSVAFPIGALLRVTANGSGGTTVAAGAGVTVHTSTNFPLALVQWSTGAWRQDSTDVWVPAV